ncbi:hypothetical protein [Actinomadura oligospora]|uniref:hypothetical protein n=1 Tax=Actinomadura oligospora TaxID=111804 RepID=UPI00047DA3C2|nr:hypothetical protein [Actinomadura oligospora]
MTPAAVSGPQRLDVFLLGTNWQLYHYWWPRVGGGQPFGLESLGGGWLRQDVSAVRWRGRLDVFVVGPDAALHHFWQLPGEPFQSESLGGRWRNPVSRAVAHGSGLHVFIIGDDFQLWRYSTQLVVAGSLTVRPFELEPVGGGPYNPGYPWTGNRRIAATSWGPDWWDAFVADNDYGLVHHWRRPDGAPSHELLARRHAQWIDAASGRRGRLDVFTQLEDPDLAPRIGHLWQNPGEGFRFEALEYYALGAAPPAAVTWGYPRLDAFVPSGAGLRHHWQENNPFDSEDLGGVWVNGRAAATTWGPRRLDVFAVGDDHQLYHYWQG